MAEIAFGRQSNVDGNASHDGVNVTFDRLLREYFLSEQQHAVSRHTASAARGTRAYGGVNETPFRLAC
jgi:hypothetical protein